MIAAPAFIAAMIALCCAAGLWYAVERNTGLGFDDNEDFFEAGGVISDTISTALNSPKDKRMGKLSELSTLMDREAMALFILLDGAGYYSCGKPTEHDGPLIEAAKTLTGDVAVSSGGRSLYARELRTKEGLYKIYLFSSISWLSFADIKAEAVFALIVFLFAVFVSIMLTNRFLTKFVLRRIERPLDILADGVTRIRDGELGHRIDYAEEDEFSPVCAAFNEMAERLRASVDEARRHEEGRRELTAGISHDLRSPLTSIRAYVEGLLDGVAQTPEARKRYLLTIRDKAEDMNRLVSQMFLFSKMELEDYPMRVEAVQLDKELALFLKETAPDYERRGLSVVSELHEAAAMADVVELRRALSNIMDNSVKYSNSHNPSMRITLSRADGFCRLTLADDGPGVAREALPKLFDLFYRSDPSRRNPNGGSGLGLSIAARAVRRMGGAIEAENGAEGGLIIVIKLLEVTMECTKSSS